MNDLISRSDLIAELESVKQSLGDVFFRAIVDKVIERVREMPATKPPRPEVELDMMRRGIRLRWPDGSTEVLL